MELYRMISIFQDVVNHLPYSNRRYQQEHAVPDRFKLQSVATRNAAFQTKEPPPANPVYNTSYQEYGKYHPNEHTQPQSYHGLRTKFSYKKYQQGMYRNHSLNV